MGFHGFGGIVLHLSSSTHILVMVGLPQIAKMVIKSEPICLFGIQKMIDL
jgi:hypothetical protein